MLFAAILLILMIFGCSDGAVELDPARVDPTPRSREHYERSKDHYPNIPFLECPEGTIERIVDAFEHGYSDISQLCVEWTSDGPGVPHGPSISWRPGKPPEKLLISHYKHGVRHGTQQFFSNGSVTCTRIFEEGQELERYGPCVERSSQSPWRARAT